MDWCEMLVNSTRGRRGLGAALTAALVLASPLRAVAQEPEPEAGAVAEASPSTPGEGRRTRDAASNRGLVFPVAETTPEGDWEITDYEIILLTLAYGATDRLQLSLTTMLPIVEDQPFFLWITGKYAVYRSDTVVFSPLLSFNIFNADSETAVLMTIGALVDLILGERGQGALSFGLLGAFALVVPGVEQDDTLDTFNDSALLLNTSFTWEVGSFVKLLLEVALPAALIDGKLEVAEGVLLNYGVRFFNEMFAGDIGFAKPIGADDDPFILGFPVATFTVRF